MSLSRRELVKNGLLAGTLLPVLGRFSLAAQAADLPPVAPADPTAKALGFVTDSAQVDTATNPTHKPDQRCATCVQFQGRAGDARGGCSIFAGHSVPATGWCKAWTKKPGI